MKTGSVGFGVFGALGLVMALTSVSFADGYPGHDHGPGNGGGNQNEELDRRVDRLERETSEMRDSIRRLEQRLDSLTQAPPPAAIVSACMLVDTGFTRTFLGVSMNRLDAEYSARKACQTSVNATFCGATAQLKCDDNSAAPYATRVCMVTDSGFNRLFRGEGRTFVEAEAKAKQACQDSVNPSFCSNVTAQCQ